MKKRLGFFLSASLLMGLSACSQSDWNHFWSVEGDWSQARPTSTLYQHNVSTARQCRGIGGTWGAQGCWRL